MSRHLLFAVPGLVVLLFCGKTMLPAQSSVPTSDLISSTIEENQYDLAAEGRTFLLNEARANDYFMLGELHGENEIPALLRSVRPAMWKDGYRHIAAEVSPWAAQELEFGPSAQGEPVQSLWSRQQANDAHLLAGTNEAVLWACDIEEMQPQSLIRELAALNAKDPDLARMLLLTKDGYSRKLAAELLTLATKADHLKDKEINGISLYQNLLATLRIETLRSKPETKLVASTERELLMKHQLLAHLQQEAASNSKTMLRFGRNHLHRGYDARGVSTLGNFVAEYAVAHGQKAFNVGAFAAGGKETLLGESWDADERQDEAAFALLASKARYPATIFDLRGLRSILHNIPAEKRSPLEANLVYWADSYDALVCYKTVTPLRPEN